MLGIPLKLRLQEIVHLVDKQFKDQFNFINCPPNNVNLSENLGYFVINFKNTEKIYRFTKDFLDKKLFSCEDTDGSCRIWRTVQFCRVQRVACNARNIDSTYTWKQSKMPTATTNYYRVGSQAINTIMTTSDVQGRKEKPEIALVDESTEEEIEIEKEKRERKGRGKVLEIEKGKAKRKEKNKEEEEEEKENEDNRKRKSVTRLEKRKSTNLDEGKIINKDKNKNKNKKEIEPKSANKNKNKNEDKYENNDKDEENYEDDQSEIPTLTDGVARKKKKKIISSYDVNIPILPTANAFLTTLPLPQPLVPLIPSFVSRDSELLDPATHEKNFSRSNISTIKNFNKNKNSNNNKNKNNKNKNYDNNNDNINDYNNDNNDDDNNHNNNNNKYHINNDEINSNYDDHTQNNKKRERERNERKRIGIVKSSAEHSNQIERQCRVLQTIPSQAHSHTHSNSLKNSHTTFDSEEECEIHENTNTNTNTNDVKILEIPTKKLKLKTKTNTKTTTKLKKKCDLVEDESEDLKIDDVTQSSEKKGVKIRKCTKIDEIPYMKSGKTKKKKLDNAEIEQEEKGEVFGSEGKLRLDRNRYDVVGERKGIVKLKRKREGEGEAEGERIGEGGIGDGVEESACVSYKKKKNKTAASITSKAVEEDNREEIEEQEMGINDYSTNKDSKKNKCATIINKKKINNFIKTNIEEQELNVSESMIQYQDKNQNQDNRVMKSMVKKKKERKSSKEESSNKTGPVYQGTKKKFKVTSDDNTTSSVSRINWGLDDGA